MRRVVILSRSLQPGDAVSNDILGMRRLLLAGGHRVDLFAQSWEPGNYQVENFDQAGGALADPDTILVYHFAVGWEAAAELIKQAPCKKVIKYHNVTPPRFFEGVNQDYAELCRRGREQLALIAQANCELYLSDSDYNARELIAAGAPAAASRVVPPFHQVDELESIAADSGVWRRFGQGEVTNVLAVGRLVPNKNHGLLIEAFGLYHRDYNPQSRLLIVGKQDSRLEVYTDRLRALTLRLGLQDAVHFVGGVGNGQLKAYYQLAKAFVSTSEHEGFCVPLVEAMALKVPVVALGSTAVPDTLGAAGLVWRESDPALFASSIHLLATDAVAARTLTEAGIERYQQRYSNQRIGERCWESLGPLLSR